MYLALISVGLCFQYVLMHYLLYFFETEQLFKFEGKYRMRLLISFLVITFISFFSYLISFAITDTEISNRVLHGLGGGFVSFIACFLAFRDLRNLYGINIHALQFFILSFLVVMFMGIVNEIIEFFIEVNFGIIAAPTTHDTWLDLVSNLTGAVVGMVIALGFLKKK